MLILKKKKTIERVFDLSKIYKELCHHRILYFYFFFLFPSFLYLLVFFIVFCTNYFLFIILKFNLYNIAIRKITYIFNKNLSVMV